MLKSLNIEVKQPIYFVNFITLLLKQIIPYVLNYVNLFYKLQAENRKLKYVNRCELLDYLFLSKVLHQF
jgi:hypothetical protein